MILGCRTEHLKNKTVLVNGNSYLVGDNGICTDVTEADAAKLLENKRQWYRLGGTTPDAITRELDANPDTLPVDAAGELRHLDIPEQAAPITQDGEQPSFAHRSDGSVEPIKKKRGRPPRIKEL